MSKLLTFHCQGERQSITGIADALSAADSGLKVTPTRLFHLLHSQTRPTEAERLALARHAGLNDDQIAYIEDGIETGAISQTLPARQSPFTFVLGRILDKLAVQNIGQTQLALLCANQHVSGALPIQQSDLSYYRSGRHTITLQKLRSLIAGLKQLTSQRLTDPVTAEEISGLIVAAGFTTNDLGNTTHDIIARIEDDTRIKPLLSALRNAIDVSMASNDVIEQGQHLGFALPNLSHFKHWEQGDSIYPTSQQVAELLRCYNHFIRSNGFPPLEDTEIAKVVQAAERNHARWHSLTAAERLAHRKPHDRQRPLSPSFPDSTPDR